LLVIGGSITAAPMLAASNHGVFVVSDQEGQPQQQQPPSGKEVQPQQPQSPSGQVDVDIDVNRGGGGTIWYLDPVWIGIGIVALLALIAIIAMAARGGGTTIVKD
jgi:hypothetical protein